MKRNIITYILSYLIASICTAAFYVFWDKHFVMDNQMNIIIFHGILFCLPLAVFFLAGKLFLMPTGKRKKDFSAFYPGILLIPVIMMFFRKIYGYKSLSDFLNDCGHVYLTLLYTIFGLLYLTVLPSLFLWLGMLSNKKKARKY